MRREEAGGTTQSTEWSWSTSSVRARKGVVVEVGTRPLRGRSGEDARGKGPRWSGEGLETEREPGRKGDEE